jgi:DNA repair exonuclease SbcCD ATPase subunit
MLPCLSSRLALVAVLSAASLPATVLAQSQDSQSVAEAARRAREQKKAQATPAKVITDDDVKHAAPATPATPAATEAKSAPTAPAASSADKATAPTVPTPSGASTEQRAKDEKAAKEIAQVKEQVKQAESDLDLAQREQALEQDSYFSNPDYVHDTAGKAKLEGLKQQISDKQQELDKLKARLAELQASQGNSAATPPKP